MAVFRDYEVLLGLLLEFCDFVQCHIFISYLSCYCFIKGVLNIRDTTWRPKNTRSYIFP
jgi:hypothetical protein